MECRGYPTTPTSLRSRQRFYSYPACADGPSVGREAPAAEKSGNSKVLNQPKSITSLIRVQAGGIFIIAWSLITLARIPFANSTVHAAFLAILGLCFAYFGTSMIRSGRENFDIKMPEIG